VACSPRSRPVLCWPRAKPVSNPAPNQLIPGRLTCLKRSCSARYCRPCICSVRFWSVGPLMVYVFPLDVCPYANTHALWPSITPRTRGASSSYISACAPHRVRVTGYGGCSGGPGGWGAAVHGLHGLGLGSSWFALSTPQAPAEGWLTCTVHGAEIVFFYRINVFCDACTASEHPAPPSMHLDDPFHRCRESLHPRPQ
jgi:hypothetical protein